MPEHQARRDAQLEDRELLMDSTARSFGRAEPRVQVDRRVRHAGGADHAAHSAAGIAGPIGADDPGQYCGTGVVSARPGGDPHAGHVQQDRVEPLGGGLLLQRDGRHAVRDGICRHTHLHTRQRRAERPGGCRHDRLECVVARQRGNARREQDRGDDRREGVHHPARCDEQHLHDQRRVAGNDSHRGAQSHLRPGAVRSDRDAAPRRDADIAHRDTFMKYALGIRPRPDGFSLVELMIAMTISLFLLIGIASVTITHSISSRELEKTSRQIETGRYAMQVIGNDLTLAGFYGTFSPKGATVSTPDPCATALGNLGFNNTSSPITVPAPVYGYAPGAVAPTCLASLQPNTGIVVVRRASSTATPVASAVAGQTYLQASGCTGKTAPRSRRCAATWYAPITSARATCAADRTPIPRPP